MTMQLRQDDPEGDWTVPAALTGVAGDLSYAQLHDQVCRTTATGKVRRVELRRMAARVFVPSDPPTEAVPS